MQHLCNVNQNDRHSLKNGYFGRDLHGGKGLKFRKVQRSKIPDLIAENTKSDGAR